MRIKIIMLISLLAFVLPLSSYAMEVTPLPVLFLISCKKSEIYQKEGAFVEVPAELTGFITGNAVTLPTMPITIITGDFFNVFQVSFNVGYYSAGLPFYLVKKTLWDAPIDIFEAIFISEKEDVPKKAKTIKREKREPTRAEKIANFRRIFDVQSPSARLTMTLKAINEGLITIDGITFEELKQMFGKRLYSSGDYKSKKEPFTCRVLFEDPISPPPGSQMSGAIEGWYINFYFIDGSLENYALSNVHKTCIGLYPKHGK